MLLSKCHLSLRVKRLCATQQQEGELIFYLVEQFQVLLKASLKLFTLCCCAPEIFSFANQMFYKITGICTVVSFNKKNNLHNWPLRMLWKRNQGIKTWGKERRAQGDEGRIWWWERKGRESSARLANTHLTLGPGVRGHSCPVLYVPTIMRVPGNIF